MRAGLLVLLAACAPGAAAPDAGAAAAADADASPVAAAAADAGPSRGCPGASLLPVPEDFSAPGPWPVGVRTVTAAGMKVEIWYPARPDAERKTPVVYDLGEQLPPGTRLTGELPAVPCACWRDLPLDDAHGRYPVVLFMHGLTLFRWESATLTAHWASRGFVVVAPDLPAVDLAGVLERAPRHKNSEDAARLLTALDAPDGELAFLAGHIDMEQLALTGHSLGADVASVLAATRGRVVIAMAERGIAPAERRFSTLVIGGMDDRIEPYARQRRGYATTPTPKRLVGIARAGHMSFSDVCSVARKQGGLFAVALQRGVPMKGFLATLARDGCKQIALAPERAWRFIKYATTAALEETLTCAPGAAAAFRRLPDLFVEIGEYQEEL